MRISDWSSDVCSSDLLRFDGFRVGDGIDLAFDMGDVIIDEAAEHMHDRIHFPDIGEELIAQTLSPGGTAHKSCNIDKGKLCFDDLRAATDLGNFIKPFIRHRHLAHIGFYGAERIIGRLRRLRLSKRSEEHTSELQSLMRISYAVF